jgi:hypothetical protein
MGSAWEFDVYDIVERLGMVLGELISEVGDNSCMKGKKEGLLTIIDDGCGLVVGMVRMVSQMLINENGGFVREGRMVGLVEEGVVIG